MAHQLKPLQCGLSILALEEEKVKEFFVLFLAFSAMNHFFDLTLADFLFELKGAVKYYLSLSETANPSLLLALSKLRHNLPLFYGLLSTS